MVQLQTGNMLDVIVEGKSIGLKQRDSDHRKYEVIWLPEPEGLRDVLTAEINRLNPSGHSLTGKVSGEQIVTRWWNAEGAPKIREGEPLTGVSKSLADAVDAALATVRKEARKAALLQAAKDVCMYCSGNATGYESALGPNAAGNYTHCAKNMRDKTVLCEASSIYARLRFEASAKW